MSPSRRDLAELLARTLASLVTAKVEGLLGDVRIAGPAGKNLSILANHAGCDLIEAENEAAWLGLALQEARGPNVFLLRCGRIPEAGFIEEAGDFLASHSKDQPRAAYLHALPESFIERIFPSLAPVAGTHRLPRSHAGRAARRLSKARGLCCSRDHIFYARPLHPLTESDVCFPGRTVPKPSRNGFRRML